MPANIKHTPSWHSLLSGSLETKFGKSLANKVSKQRINASLVSKGIYPFCFFWIYGELTENTTFNVLPSFLHENLTLIPPYYVLVDFGISQNSARNGRLSVMMAPVPLNLCA